MNRSGPTFIHCLRRRCFLSGSSVRPKMSPLSPTGGNPWYLPSRSSPLGCLSNGLGPGCRNTLCMCIRDGQNDSFPQISSFSSVHYHDLFVWFVCLIRSLSKKACDVICHGNGNYGINVYHEYMNVAYYFLMFCRNYPG